MFRSPWLRRGWFFCFNEVPCVKHDAERLEALLHNFPPPINTSRYLHTPWLLLFLLLLQCCDVIYFSDLVIPLSCVKVQRHSVTEMDWAVNLPHRSPQTHSLCHRYPEAATASFPPFPPFPREHWQVKGLDKSYISLCPQISHHESVLLYLSLSRSLLALFSMKTNSVVPFNKEPGFIKAPARFSK